MSAPFQITVAKYSNLGYTLKTPFEVHKSALIVIARASGIGIARALYLERSIYMFDEPTASLDSANVNSVLDILSTLGKNHIVFCTSHDELLIDRADIQLHFQDGIIVPIFKTHD